MVKHLFVFFSILCATFVLASCSDSLDNKSSVSFAISEAVFREVISSDVSGDISDSDQGETKTYSVEVTVSWEKDQNRSKTETVFADSSGTISCPTFKFDDLPAGKTVKVEVSIYNGELLVYKTETPEEIELKPGENACDLELTKCIADLVISIENKEEIALDETASYKLVAQLSGDYDFKSETLIANKNTTLPIENLSIGKTVNLDVAIYKDTLCVYKMAEPKSITISETKEIAVTLKNAVSTAAVWINNINYAFYQSKSYDAEGNEFKGSGSCYTFDGDGNLWSAMSAPDSAESKADFYKYVMESGLYTTTEDGNPYKTYTVTIGANQSVVDIYWDNSTLYALVKYSNNNTSAFYLNSYAINANDDTLTPKLNSLEITLPSEDTTSPSLSTLAVNGSKVIIGAEDSASVFMNYIVNGKFVSSEFSAVGSFNISGLTDTGNICVTDLQFGDGLGNYADKIYALVRNYTASFDNTASVVYSNGALVEIDIESVSYKLHGYENISKSLKLSSSSTPDTIFYAPSADDSDKFFGPTKFVALVPKKLVILDDGISFTEGTDGIASASNNDSLFEFDIATNSIKKGASVVSSVPYASSISKDWN